MFFQLRLRQNKFEEFLIVARDPDSKDASVVTLEIYRSGGEANEARLEQLATANANLSNHPPEALISLEALHICVRGDKTPHCDFAVCAPEDERSVGS